jgi:hypothetical protein
MSSKKVLTIRAGTNSSGDGTNAHREAIHLGKENKGSTSVSLTFHSDIC